MVCSKFLLPSKNQGLGSLVCAMLVCQKDVFDMFVQPTFKKFKKDVH